VGCAVAIAVVGTGCGGGNAASQLAKAPDYNPRGQTKCSVESSQAKPLVVEWPAPERLALEIKARSGLVAVKYTNCEMTVLDRCSIQAKYTYVGGTKKEDEIEINDADDLYANLPVGAAKLEGKLSRSGRLTVKMDLVGRYQSERTSVRADELQGDCDGATHFIYGVTLGAFDFYAGGQASMSGGAGVAGVGAGGSSSSDRESIMRDGDPTACSKASPDDKSPPLQCGALIRIEVVPIGAAKTFAPACPEGTRWDGSQCLGKKVMTQVDCPAGTTWNGQVCSATVNTNCAAGMHFQAGQGCVADGGPPPSEQPAAATPAPPVPQRPQPQLVNAQSFGIYNQSDAAAYCRSAEHWREKRHLASAAELAKLPTSDCSGMGCYIADGPKIAYAGPVDGVVPFSKLPPYGSQSFYCFPDP
jgi:hypothetical protein